MVLNKMKSWLAAEDEEMILANNQYYTATAEQAIDEDGSTRMVLLEPRAYSETVQIAEQLKLRNTVLVNLKRVTKDQAKRIIDFLSGTVYAIDGNIEKVGGGIFLCAPNNVKVNGKITEETEGKDIHDNTDVNIEW